MDDLLPVAEAARVMGISRDALYKRIRRNSVEWVEGEDGRIHVRVDTATDAAMDADVDADIDASTDQATLIASLEEQVAYLREIIRSRDEEIRRREEEYREESRRKDHLLAAALERIPAIEPPSDARESPVSASEEQAKGQVPPEPEKAESRPWWRKLFGR